MKAHYWNMVKPNYEGITWINIITVSVILNQFEKENQIFYNVCHIWYFSKNLL